MKNFKLGNYKKVREQIELAFESGKRIMFLHTNELELVEYIVTYPPCLECNVLKGKSSEGEITPSSIMFDLPDIELPKDKDAIGLKMDIAQPTLFVLFADETENAQHYNDETRALNKKLHQFIQLYTNVATRREGKGELKVPDEIEKSFILVVTAETPQIPANIEPYSEYIKLMPLEEDELKRYVSDLIVDLDGEVKKHKDGSGLIEDKEFLDAITKYLKGLSAVKIRQVLKRVHEERGQIYIKNWNEECKDFKELVKAVRAGKEQFIATSSILHLEKDFGNKKAAGLGNLEQYLDEKKDIVKNADENKKKFRMDAPKGILVAGIPGSGKSLMAQYTAHLLGLPLIRMDMSDVQNKYVGESERRMVEALDMVNAMSPCVLWIDEIEKSFAGSGGSDSSGVTQRLFGKFLTWMQDKEKKEVCCFVFATANNVSQLPPELFRSGRFDAKFYTFMPTAKECGEIFQSIIDGQNKDNERLFDSNEINGKYFITLLDNRKLCLKGYIDKDVTSVNRKNKFVSGADIENIVKRAKEIYLRDNKNLSSDEFTFRTNEFKVSLIKAIEEIKTYGETNLEKIADCYASMAANNFTPASKRKECEDEQLIPFDGYDAHRIIEKEKKHELYHLEDEDKHLGKWENDYDKCLYLMIRNVLNRDAEEITYAKNKKEYV